MKNKERTSFAFPDIEWKSNFFIMWDDTDKYADVRDSAKAFNKMMETAAGSDYAGNYFNYIDTSGIINWRYGSMMVSGKPWIRFVIKATLSNCGVVERRHGESGSRFSRELLAR